MKAGDILQSSFLREPVSTSFARSWLQPPSVHGVAWHLGAYAVFLPICTGSHSWKVGPQALASEVRVQCARIRTAGALDAFPCILAGYLLGGAVFFAEIVVPSGFALRSAGGNPGVDFLDFIKGLDPVVLMAAVVSLVAVVWLAPRVNRRRFDRRAAVLTRARLARQRRARRRVPWIIVGVGVLFITAMTAVAFLVAWQPAAISAAKLAATGGSSVVALGLFGRRGARLVCAKCDYPMGTWRGAPEQCPECGCSWRKPWGARFGQRGVRWKLVLGGAALLVTSALLMAVFWVWGFRIR